MMFKRLKKRTVALMGLLGLAAESAGVGGAADPGCAEYGTGGRRLDRA